MAERRLTPLPLLLSRPPLAFAGDAVEIQVEPCVGVQGQFAERSSSAIRSSAGCCSSDAAAWLRCS